MATNKVPKIPFQELPSGWIAHDKYHVDSSATATASFLILNPTNIGYGTYNYGSGNDGTSPALLKNRVIEVCSGPPIDSAATGQLAESYRIAGVELSWDQISTLCSSTTAATANAGFINAMLVKLSTSQSVVNPATAYGQTSTAGDPKLGLSWPYLAGTAAVGPGAYNCTLIGRDTSSMAAGSDGIIPKGRIVFNLSDDIAATVTAHGLTRTPETNRLLPGERLVLILTPTKSDRTIYAGTDAKVYAFGLKTNVLLQKYRL